jgi:hypothetical protein
MGWTPANKTKRAAKAALFVKFEASRSRAAGAARSCCNATGCGCGTGCRANDTQSAQTASGSCTTGRACTSSRTCGARTSTGSAAACRTCGRTTNLIALALKLLGHTELAADSLDRGSVKAGRNRLCHYRSRRNRRSGDRKRHKQRSNFTNTLHAGLLKGRIQVINGNSYVLQPPN